MRVFLLVLLVAATDYGQATNVVQPATTLEQAIGKEKIQSILKDVVARSIPQAKENYLLTDQSLAGVQSSGVPATFSTKLQTLKGREIVGRENLFYALNERAGKDDAVKYQRVVAFYTHSIVVVTDDFYSRIQKLVLRAAAPKSVEAQKWLEFGFQKFMTDYTAFLRESSPDKSTVVIGFRLEEFLTLAATKCGRVPCDVPPCCGKNEEYCADPCKSP